ncbi:MAG: AEC family transporter, partial [Kiritimatiellae bacterium]|nr:AEC family transporter [Kiritimatiellia bacterium]
MSFLDTFARMMVILFAMAVGYGVDRLGWLDPETDTKLSNLALNITIPSLVLSTVMTGEELPAVSEILGILLVGVVFYVMEFVYILLLP